MSDDGDYGRFYWCVKVPESLCPRGEIYVYADSVQVSPCGALEMRSDGDHGVNQVFAPGQWFTMFAASCFDGHAVAVEHWEGEVVR